MNNTESIVRPVSPAFWGRDHWSTFAYVESRCVDHKGLIDKEKMRTDNKRHPLLTGGYQRRFGCNGGKYPTVLKDTSLNDHDDWDCLLDMEAAGLLIIDRNTVPDEALITEPGRRGQISGMVNWNFNPKVSLTELGIMVAGLLRAHKIRGGKFSNFIWPPVTDSSSAKQIHD